MTTIFFGNANLPWISPLCDELAKTSFTTRITILIRFRLSAFNEIFSFWLKGNRNKIQNWYYPPGFNSILSIFFKKSISIRLKNVVNEATKQTAESPFVFVSDVSLSKYLNATLDYKVVYLIYDLYPKDKVSIQNHHYLIQISATVLCSSAELTDKIKFENPSFIDKIFHFPHGSNIEFLNKELYKEPAENYVIINGYLTARYNWSMIYTVIKVVSEIKFLFVGNLVYSDFNKSRESWLTIFEELIKLPNVNHISNLHHCETVNYYWASTIVWLPYDLSIEFNIYSCPLKIMDGICSGRPVISTGIPESMKHKEYITICDDTISTIKSIRTILKYKTMPKSHHFAEKQLKYALNNSWEIRATQYLNILNKQKL